MNIKKIVVFPRHCDADNRHRIVWEYDNGDTDYFYFHDDGMAANFIMGILISIVPFEFAFRTAYEKMETFHNDHNETMKRITIDIEELQIQNNIVPARGIV